MTEAYRRQIRVVYLACGHQRRIGIGSEVDRYDATRLWCRVCLMESPVAHTSPPRD